LVSVSPFYEETLCVSRNSSNQEFKNFLDKIDGPGKVWISLNQDVSSSHLNCKRITLLILDTKSDQTFEDVEASRPSLTNAQVVDRMQALQAERRPGLGINQGLSDALQSSGKDAALVKPTKKGAESSRGQLPATQAPTRGGQTGYVVQHLTPLQPTRLSFSNITAPNRSVPTQSDYLALFERLQRAENELLGKDTSCRVCSRSLSGVHPEVSQPIRS
jgi:hypothetical protein